MPASVWGRVPLCIAVGLLALVSGTVPQGSHQVGDQRPPPAGVIAFPPAEREGARYAPGVPTSMSGLTVLDSGFASPTNLESLEAPRSAPLRSGPFPSSWAASIQGFSSHRPPAPPAPVGVPTDFSTAVGPFQTALTPSPGTYPVVFILYGYEGPGGPGVVFNWSITLDGVTNVNFSYTPANFSAPLSLVVFTEPNGTYNWSVADFPRNWTGVPSSGVVSVRGTSIDEAITLAWAASDAIVDDVNLSYGSTTVVREQPQGGGSYAYNISAFVDSTVSPGITCNGHSTRTGQPGFELGGTGFSSESTLNVTCNQLPTLNTVDDLLGALPGMSVLWVNQTTGQIVVPLSARVSAASPAYEADMGIGGITNSWVTVNLSNRQPDINIIGNVTSATGPNSTGRPCPCDVTLLGLESVGGYYNYTRYLNAPYKYLMTYAGSVPYVTFESNSTDFSFSLPPGSYLGEFGADAGYDSEFPGADTDFDFVIGAGVAPVLPTYAVSFNGSDLPSDASWTVDVVGEGSQTVTGSGVAEFLLPNGTYDFSIRPPDGFPVVMISTSDGTRLGGSFTVDGQSLDIEVEFGASYNLTFAQTSLSDLADNQSWGVTVGTTTLYAPDASAQLTFELPNGTYPFTIVFVRGHVSETNATSPLTINGEDVDVGVTFTAFFGVLFSEIGIPFKTVGVLTELPSSWSVTLGDNSGPDQTERSNLTQILFSRSNGSFSFSVGAPKGWQADPSTSSVVINGSAESITIVFRFLYGLTIQKPEGVASGETWGASLSGSTITATEPTIASNAWENTTAASLEFDEPNGTYRYAVSVLGDPGYAASGVVTIQGQNVTVTPPPLGGGSTGAGSAAWIGLLTSHLLYVLAGIVIVAVVVLGAFTASRRSPR